MKNKFKDLPKHLITCGFKGHRNGCYTFPEEPISEIRVNKVSEWIAGKFEKSEALKLSGYSISSYSLKHIVERNIGEYVSNGELIAAMILLGFKYKETGINADFFVKKKSLKPYINL